MDKSRKRTGLWNSRLKHLTFHLKFCVFSSFFLLVKYLKILRGKGSTILSVTNSWFWLLQFEIWIYENSMIYFTWLGCKHKLTDNSERQCFEICISILQITCFLINYWIFWHLQSTQFSRMIKFDLIKAFGQVFPRKITKQLRTVTIWKTTSSELVRKPEKYFWVIMSLSWV